MESSDSQIITNKRQRRKITQENLEGLFDESSSEKIISSEEYEDEVGAEMDDRGLKNIFGDGSEYVYALENLEEESSAMQEEEKISYGEYYNFLKNNFLIDDFFIKLFFEGLSIQEIYLHKNYAGEFHELLEIKYFLHKLHDFIREKKKCTGKLKDKIWTYEDMRDYNIYLKYSLKNTFFIDNGQLLKVDDFIENIMQNSVMHINFPKKEILKINKSCIKNYASYISYHPFFKKKVNALFEEHKDINGIIDYFMEFFGAENNKEERREILQIAINACYAEKDESIKNIMRIIFPYFFYLKYAAPKNDLKIGIATCINNKRKINFYDSNVELLGSVFSEDRKSISQFILQKDIHLVALDSADEKNKILYNFLMEENVNVFFVKLFSHDPKSAVGFLLYPEIEALRNVDNIMRAFQIPEKFHIVLEDIFLLIVALRKFNFNYFREHEIYAHEKNILEKIKFMHKIKTEKFNECTFRGLPNHMIFENLYPLSTDIINKYFNGKIISIFNGNAIAIVKINKNNFKVFLQLKNQNAIFVNENYLIRITDFNVNFLNICGEIVENREFNIEHKNISYKDGVEFLLRTGEKFITIKKVDYLCTLVNMHGIVRSFKIFDELDIRVNDDRYSSFHEFVEFFIEPFLLLVDRIVSHEKYFTDEDKLKRVIKKSQVMVYGFAFYRKNPEILLFMRGSNGRVKREQLKVNKTIQYEGHHFNEVDAFVNFMKK